MLEYLRYKLELRRDLNRYSQVEYLYQRDIAEARKAKTKADEIRSIEEGCRWELELIQDEIEWATSRYICNRAFEHQISLPPHDSDGWTTSGQLGVRYLSRKGAMQVKGDIRSERKADWDFWATRVTFALAIIGSVFGVLAYFNK